MSGESEVESEWLAQPVKEGFASSEDRRKMSRSLAALRFLKRPLFEIVGWRLQTNNSKSAIHETIKSMRSKINIDVRNITLLWAIAITVASASVARAADTWILSTSSFTTNVTLASGGVNDFGGYDGSTLTWTNVALGTASHSVSDSALGVSQDMSGYASIVLYGWPDDGPYGKALIASFQATADATWSDSGGATQTQITTVGNLTGSLGTENEITLPGGYTLTTADAAGRSDLSVTGQFTEGNFASITNDYSTIAGATNSVFDSGDTSLSSESVTTTNYGPLVVQLSSVDYSVTWTNIYTTTGGLTSLSASSVMTGMAIANLLADESEWIEDTVNASVTLSGSVLTTLKTSVNE